MRQNEPETVDAIESSVRRRLRNNVVKGSPFRSGHSAEMTAFGALTRKVGRATSPLGLVTLIVTDRVPKAGFALSRPANSLHGPNERGSRLPQPAR